MDEEYIYTLFEKYRAGRLSPDERDALKAWIEASDENREEFVTFLRVHKHELQYRLLGRLDTGKAWEAFLRRRRFRTVSLRIGSWAAAAAVLLIGCWAGYAYWNRVTEADDVTLAELFPNHGQRQALFVSGGGERWTDEGPSLVWRTPSDAGRQSADNRWNSFSACTRSEGFNEVHVPRGGEYSLTLPDGTKVWLNAHSTLRYSYPFDSLRAVQLEGEGYFEVTPSDKPFQVAAAGHAVRVLGTKFDVRAYDDQPLRVTLVEGLVQVSGEAGKQLLHPDGQLTVEHGGYALRQVNARSATAWARGEFEFDNTPLEEIVRQLERWYNAEIVFASDDLHAIRFTGTILRRESLGYALEMIQKVSDVRFSKQGDRVLIEREEPNK